jgi:hypothetical protein
VSLVGVLMGGLRMLLSSVRMFLALHMIALAVVLSGTAVSFGSIFVMFSGFVVLVSCHVCVSFGMRLPVPAQDSRSSKVPSGYDHPKALFNATRLANTSETTPTNRTTPKMYPTGEEARPRTCSGICLSFAVVVALNELVRALWRLVIVIPIESPDRGLLAPVIITLPEDGGSIRH